MSYIDECQKAERAGRVTERNLIITIRVTGTCVPYYTNRVLCNNIIGCAYCFANCKISRWRHRSAKFMALRRLWKIRLGVKPSADYRWRSGRARPVNWWYCTYRYQHCVHIWRQDKTLSLTNQIYWHGIWRGGKGEHQSKCLPRRHCFELSFYFFASSNAHPDAAWLVLIVIMISDDRVSFIITVASLVSLSSATRRQRSPSDRRRFPVLIAGTINSCGEFPVPAVPTRPWARVEGSQPAPDARAMLSGWKMLAEILNRNFIH